MGGKHLKLSILARIMWRYIAKSQILWGEEVEK